MCQDIIFIDRFFLKRGWVPRKNLQPQLAGREIALENRRILYVFEDRRKRLDAPNDEDHGFERYSSRLHFQTQVIDRNSEDQHGSPGHFLPKAGNIQQR